MLVVRFADHFCPASTDLYGFFFGEGMAVFVQTHLVDSVGTILREISIEIKIRKTQREDIVNLCKNQIEKDGILDKMADAVLGDKQVQHPDMI